MIDSYRSGYTKALLDIKNWFEKHSDSLKHAKMFNQKKISALFQGFIDNRDIMIENGESTEFVFTKEGKVVTLEEFERNKR